MPGSAPAGNKGEIERRNRRWFPHHVPAHETYLAAANTAATEAVLIAHLGAGCDSFGVAGRLGRRKIVSIDLDEKGLARNANRLRVVADVSNLPLRSASCRLAIFENVFEHLENPLAALRETHRILAGGGVLVFLCPNRFSYISLVAVVTPHRFHVWFRRLTARAAEHDTFRTYYRLNSQRRISKLSRETGFIVESLRSFVGWPTYWEFSDLLHRAAVVGHWLLERGPRIFHVTLVGVLRKRAEAR